MLEKLIHIFDLDIKHSAPVENSFSSTVYRCVQTSGETVYIKIPFSRVKLFRELEAYRLLKAHIPIPTLLDFWTGDEHSIGALLLKESTGVQLSVDSSATIAFQVGQVHAKMHSIPPPANQKITYIENVFQEWPQFLDRQFYSFAIDAKPLLEESLYNKAIHTFEKMKLQLPESDGPSFIHMDFRPGNILVTSSEVSSLIDFETVRFGSTEVDFTKIYRDYLSHDLQLYEAYQEGYTSIRPLIDLERVLPFYRFTDAFNSIGWCNRRGLEQNIDFYERNLDILKAEIS
ncbi:aminoglycoside phosphotransferase family protein [Exiguobacterium aestuarii]|uniref:aminoglycoside phosphotransferase family protein n=1 Tax=Exiguobacterium aestuarii TaxID=273527 RepID=UPI001CD2BD22|nr:aminoglycoside phosphotransferase family protein [Exiguobacterium aestuarii]MCA0979530.1 aminoglycoside phosphotransferase family protein [Exiguobacterium aestuarii]